MRRVARGDQFVIVACDGLWDEMSSCQVICLDVAFCLRMCPSQAIHTVRGLIQQYGLRENIAQKLIDFCLCKVARPPFSSCGRCRVPTPCWGLATGMVS